MTSYSKNRVIFLILIPVLAGLLFSCRGFFVASGHAPVSGDQYATHQTDECCTHQTAMEVVHSQLMDASVAQSALSLIFIFLALAFLNNAKRRKTSDTAYQFHYMSFIWRRVGSTRLFCLFSLLFSRGILHSRAF